MSRAEGTRRIYRLNPDLVAKRALQLASQQAHALGHGEVRPEHLLLGVLRGSPR